MQTVKKGSLGQLHFKGDPIDRPPTSREWAWLMRRLVALSKWANAKLGLDKLPEDGEIAETQIKVGQCACGPVDTSPVRWQAQLCSTLLHSCGLHIEHS